MLILLLLFALPPAATGSPGPSVPGNYEIEISALRSRTGKAQVVLSGTIVLHSQSFKADDIMEPESCCLEVGHKRFLEPFNGCFVLEQREPSTTGLCPTDVPSPSKYIRVSIPLPEPRRQTCPHERA